MTLDTFQRRRAWAVLAVAAVVVLVCFATGHVVVAAVLVALTPAAVYRVTGHSWQQAFAWAFGQEPVAVPGVPPRGGRRPPPRQEQRVAAIVMLVLVVPAALGLLSALAGQLLGSDAALPVGMLMTLTWTAFAALLSRLVVQERGRAAIALAAGAATVVSILLWVGVVFA